LLSEECRASEQGYANTDEPEGPPLAHPDVSSEIIVVTHDGDIHWLAG
jgi:hypothetical protein